MLHDRTILFESLIEDDVHCAIGRPRPRCGCVGVRAIAKCVCGLVCVCVVWCLGCRGGGQICRHRGALGLHVLHPAIDVFAVAVIKPTISKAVVNLIIVSPPAATSLLPGP
jgi:hypothetical protein